MRADTPPPGTSRRRSSRSRRRSRSRRAPGAGGSGQAVTVSGVARAAVVSRSWLYSQPELREAITRLRTKADGMQISAPCDRTRMSASLQRRLDSTRDEIEHLRAQSGASSTGRPLPWRGPCQPLTLCPLHVVYAGRLVTHPSAGGLEITAHRGQAIPDVRPVSTTRTLNRPRLLQSNINRPIGRLRRGEWSERSWTDKRHSACCWFGS